jgi:CRISPR system Cascade subunit CasE
MYYTQIAFNPANRHAIRVLNDVYEQHRFIMSGFKNYDAQKVGRVLYRMEITDEGGLSAIVQSIVSPTYDSGLPHSGAIAATKTKHVLFAGKAEPEFKNGGSYRFRLRANTVVTRERKRIGLIREEALRKWFEERTEGIGVSLQGYGVVDEGYLRGDKDGENMMFKIARYEGTLLVQDGKTFSAAFVGGFGHAKGFGCGLISLART